jgi:hypothetical protein
MKNLLFLLSICLIASVGCTNKSSINEQEAGKVITNYLKGSPEYKTVHFKFGEIKFSSKQEMVLLNKYKTLANEGYISMKLLKSKKKFLAKDSSYVYRIKLLDKASDLVLKQDENRATVKVALYEVTNKKPVDFSSVNSSTAKLTISLKKVNTVFAPFEDKDENSDFITKTYRLKLNKDEGWKVTK